MTDNQSDISATSKRGVGIQDERLAPEQHRRMAGNWSDDDGAVLDAMFEPNPNGPNLIDVRSRFDVLADYGDSAQKVTRLITRSVPVGQPMGTNYAAPSTIADPVQLFPADPKRKFLRIRAGIVTPYVFSLAAPAAGADPATITVPQGYTLTPLTIFAVLQCSATVSNRVPVLAANKGAGVYQYGADYSVDIAVAATASQTKKIQWTANAGTEQQGATGTNNISPIPTRPLVGGDTLSLVTVNLDATDQYGITKIAASDFYYRVAGEKADCYMAADMPASFVWESRDHTGPVWVYAPFSAGQFPIIAESITE